MTTLRALGSSGESTEKNLAALSDIEKILAGDERFYCETYHCHMSRMACIRRQKNAENGRGKGRPIGRYFKPGASDINCQNCEQGKQIKNAERKGRGVEDKGQMADEQICKDEKCESAGRPQPIGNFQIHGPSQKPLEICRTCMGRRKREGHRKKALKKQKPDGRRQKTEDRRQKDSTEYLLTIDFSKRKEHRDMLERLKKHAEDECRKPDMQALYILKKVYKKSMNSEG